MWCLSINITQEKTFSNNFFAFLKMGIVKLYINCPGQLDRASELRIILEKCALQDFGLTGPSTLAQAINHTIDAAGGSVFGGPCTAFMDLIFPDQSPIPASP